MNRPLLALLALVATAGCSERPEPSAPESAVTAAPEVAEASVGAAVSTSSAIAALIEQQDAAWAAKDPVAYARGYAVTAEVVNPVGGLLVGREGVRAGHQFLFTGPFAGSTQTSVIRRIVFLSGATRMVDLDVQLTGYAFLPPNGLRETEPGVVRTRVKLILVQRGDGWKILAQQMTPLPPA